jgi:hypothetical protein
MNKPFRALFMFVVFLSTLVLGRCVSLDDMISIQSVDLNPDTLLDVYAADSFDINSLELIVGMDDGSIRTVMVREYMMEEDDLESLSTPGAHKITITYRGFSIETEVTILASGLPSTLLSLYRLGVQESLIDMTYEEWVETIRGEDGSDGVGILSVMINDTGELVLTLTDETAVNLGNVTGDDGLTPVVDESGYWWIGDRNTGIKAEGADGIGIESIRMNEDRELLITRTDGNVQNVGIFPDDTNQIYETLMTFFDIEEDAFIADSKTPGNPVRSYTTSTFSGWGGSIGEWDDTEVVRFKIRARDMAIMKVKVFITENDKDGEVLYMETIDTYIEPFTDAYIYVTPDFLPGIHDEKDLYLIYNCDERIDVYSDFTSVSTISEDAYQAQMTYSTNGRLLENASQMIDVSSSRKNYLSVEFGTYVDLLKLNRESVSLIKDASSQSIHVHLAERYHLVAGDTFQLFFRGIMEAVDPYHYHISISTFQGSFYPRYYEWTPLPEDAGEYPLTISVYDDEGTLLGRDSTVLDVCVPREPDRDYNILVIGDSLTSGGHWIAEGYRRFAEEGGNPAGLGYDGLNLIGTQRSTRNGLTVNHEGYPGWTWSRFMSPESPFYDEELGEINFKTYVERNAFQGIDEVYVLLTWNGMRSNMTYDEIENGHMDKASALLDRIHLDYPDAKIRCLGIQIPSQNGGTGANYGVGNYADAYGLAVTAFRYNDKLEELCLSEEYALFVVYGDVKAQFDTDYNMPQAHTYVNTRSTQTEIRGTNGVHPSISGYMQIADVFYRMLCHDFKQ